MSLTPDESKLLKLAIWDGAFNDDFDPRNPEMPKVGPAVFDKVRAMSNEAVRVKLRAYKEQALEAINTQIAKMQQDLTNRQMVLADIQAIIIAPENV